MTGARAQSHIRSFMTGTKAMLRPQTFNTISSYRKWRSSLPPLSTVGFVPTMGALHDGHVSLIRHAACENTHVVVSIFLNPAQFAPTEDLAAYPRTLSNDLSMIEDINHELLNLRSATMTTSQAIGHVHTVFVPTVEEMYPLGIPLDTATQEGTFVTVTPLASRLEGVTRPHFFRGVATVCTKLFNITQPTRAYFGQKDVQQTIVLRRLITDLHLPIDLRICPTLREPDGLAMSSRNVYLGAKRRKVAPILYKALCAAEKVYKEGDTNRENILGAARKVIDAHAEEGVSINLDYLSVAEGQMLTELEHVIYPGAVLSCALIMQAVKEGDPIVRLIDNIILD